MSQHRSPTALVEASPRGDRTPPGLESARWTGRRPQLHQERRQRLREQDRSPVRLGQPHVDGRRALGQDLELVDPGEPPARFVLPHPDQQGQRRRLRAVRVHLLHEPAPGSLTNCGSQFIRYLPVAKVNPTTAKITIPKSQIGPAYEWSGGASGSGRGRVATCAATSRPTSSPTSSTTSLRPWSPWMRPPISVCGRTRRRDLLLPVLRLRCALGDRVVERATAPARATWSDVVSRVRAAGRYNPDLGGTEGTQVLLPGSSGRQTGELRRLRPLRQVLVPLDDDDLGAAGTFGRSRLHSRMRPAFGGVRIQVADLGETFTYRRRPPEAAAGVRADRAGRRGLDRRRFPQRDPPGYRSSAPCTRTAATGARTRTTTLPGCALRVRP